MWGMVYSLPVINLKKGIYTMHIKDFLKQNEPSRKRPSATNSTYKEPLEETKELILLWKSMVQDISFFSTPRIDKTTKPFKTIHKGYHELKVKGCTLTKCKVVFEGLVHLSRHPNGSVFISKFFRDGKGKISLAHLFTDKYKEKSGMPLSWYSLKGMPMETALANLDSFLETLKYSNAKASHILAPTQIEKDHMTKLGLLRNPNLKGKFSQIHTLVWSVISDLEEYDIAPDSKEKAIASFYRNFYDWTVDSLPRLSGKSIIVNQVGQFEADDIKSDHDLACQVFLLLYLEAAAGSKFGRDNLPEITLADMTNPNIKEKFTKLVNFRGQVFK